MIAASSNDVALLRDGATFITLPAGDKSKPRLGDFGEGVNVRLSKDQRLALIAHGEHGASPNFALLCGGARVEMPDGSYRAVGAFDVDAKPERVKADGTKLPAQRGPATLSALEAQLGPLPRTLTSLTPGNGRHGLFWVPVDLNVSNKLGPGLEFQNDGQYIVFPGSTIDPKIAAAKGYLPGKYRWEDETVPIAELPDAYVKYLRERPDKPRGGQRFEGGDTGEWTSVPMHEAWDSERRWNEGKKYLLKKAPLSIRGDGGRDEMFTVCAVLTRVMRLPLDVAGEMIERYYNPRLIAAGTTAWSRSVCGPQGMCIDERLESAAKTSTIPLGDASMELRDYEHMLAGSVSSETLDTLEQEMFGPSDGFEHEEPAADAPTESEQITTEGLLSRLDERKTAEDRQRPPKELLERGDHAELANELLETSGRLYKTSEGAIWAYVPEKGIWTCDDVESALRKTVARYAGRFIKVSNEKQKPLCIDNRDINGTLEIFRLLTSAPQFFADAPAGMACADGFVTLDGVRPHAPENRARAHYALTFDPSARGAAWEVFLDDLFRDDDDKADKIRCLQEFFGAALFGLSTRFQKCLIATGEGSNGKSTLFKVMRTMFPPHVVQAISPKKWDHPFTLAELVGIYLNVVGELPNNAILQGQGFKDVVGGDMIQAERKFEPAFKFVPIAGHAFACNELPATDDQSFGFWRRFIVVEFNRNFETDPKRDTGIADTLLATERPAILAWLVAGAARVVANKGYTIPASHDRALKRWQISSDSVRMFRDDCISCASETRVKARELYMQYSAWTKGAGLKPVGEPAFGTRMKKLGHASAPNGDARYYQGLKCNFSRFDNIGA